MQISAVSNVQNHQNFGSSQTYFTKPAEILIKGKFTPKQNKLLGHLMSETGRNTEYVKKIKFSTTGRNRLCANIYGESGRTAIDVTVQQGRLQSTSRFLKKLLQKTMDIENSLIETAENLF